jgi:hypothetical protein
MRFIVVLELPRTPQAVSWIKWALRDKAWICRAEVPLSLLIGIYGDPIGNAGLDFTQCSFEDIAQIDIDGGFVALM